MPYRKDTYLPIYTYITYSFVSTFHLGEVNKFCFKNSMSRNLHCNIEANR